MSEIHGMENYYLAPLASKCLHQKRFPLAVGSNVPLPGYQGGTVGENYSLCPGSTVPGGEVQSAYDGSTTPLGKVHPQIEVEDGAVCSLLR